MLSEHGRFTGNFGRNGYFAMFAHNDTINDSRYEYLNALLVLIENLV